MNRDALRQVLQTLRDAGVSPIILKGAALAETVYPSIAARAMVDLDILIHEDEAEKVKTCLAGLGYLPQENEYFGFCKTVRFPVRIDVHDKIWYLPEAAFRRLWHQSLPCSISGAEGRMMPVDELLIYAAAHAVVHHGTLAATALEDINHICRFYRPTLDWDNIVKKVKEYNLSVPLYHIFSEAKRARNAPIPDNALNSLRPSSWEQRVESAIYKSILSAPPAANIGHILKLLSRQGFRGKIMFLVDFIFPSRAFIARRYNVSKPMSILGYQFARPLLLGAALAKLIFSWSANAGKV